MRSERPSNPGGGSSGPTDGGSAKRDAAISRSVPPSKADATAAAASSTSRSSLPPSAKAPSSKERPKPLSPAARRGRRFLLTGFYVVGAALVVTATVEVSQQTFAPSGGQTGVAACHEGLRALATSTDEARRAASGIEGEDAALARFRSTLAATWAKRDEVAALCKGTPKDERALDAIERLRYAEEHAVRLEAGDLAPLRRRVQAIVEHDLGSVRDARDDGPREPPPAP